MSDSLIKEKSKEIAIDVIKVYKDLNENKKETVMSKQLLRSGTSIGANIQEAIYGCSKADFINKLKIALKECHESEYWLELLTETGYLDNKELISKMGSLRRILIKSINTAESNINN